MNGAVLQRIAVASARLILACLCCFTGARSAAQELAMIPSAFVDIGYGARPLGMGGAYVALASDPYAVLWNPSCLPYVRGVQVTTMYAKQFGLIPYALAASALGLPGGQGMGLAALTSGDEVLRETALYLSYGRSIAVPSLANTLSLGVTVKLRLSSFGDNAGGGELRSQGSATGYGVDLGVRWKFARRWTLGILLRDPLNQLTYHNETRGVRYGEGVPAALLIGTAFLARNNLVLAMDLDKALYRDVHDRIAVGAEWMLFNAVYLRGGWGESLTTEQNRKVHCGFGIQYFHREFGVRFDFAYQLHFLAHTPRVSVSCWF